MVYFVILALAAFSQAVSSLPETATANLSAENNYVPGTNYYTQLLHSISNIVKGDYSMRSSSDETAKENHTSNGYYIPGAYYCNRFFNSIAGMLNDGLGTMRNVVVLFRVRWNPDATITTVDESPKQPDVTSKPNNHEQTVKNFEFPTAKPIVIDNNEVINSEPKIITESIPAAIADNNQKSKQIESLSPPDNTSKSTMINHPNDGNRNSLDEPAVNTEVEQQQIESDKEIDKREESNASANRNDDDSIGEANSSLKNSEVLSESRSEG